MKSLLPILFFSCILFTLTNCDNSVAPPSGSINKLTPTGTLVVTVNFESQYGERLSSEDFNAIISIKSKNASLTTPTNYQNITEFENLDAVIPTGREGVNITTPTNYQRILEFDNLPLGEYVIQVYAENGLFETCEIAKRELTEDRLTSYSTFDLQEIPTSTFDMVRIDSFVNQRYVYWSAETSPKVDKVRVVRLYYGNDRNVSKDNYIYVRNGGGVIVLNDVIGDNGTRDYLDINDFSPSSDSIYVAAYIASKGLHFHSCLGEDGRRIFSPEADPPVILAFKK